MKNILIIHPKDPTTAFLSKIYEDWGIKNNIYLYTIVDEKNIPFGKNYDVTIFIGHGNELGLYNPNTNEVLVDEVIYKHLKSDVNIHLWCYSNQFVLDNHLSGFCIGQLITDMNEVNDLFQIEDFEKEYWKNELSFSNFLLVFLLKTIFEKIIESDIIEKKELDYLLDSYYNKPYNKIVQFNRTKIEIVTTYFM